MTGGCHLYLAVLPLPQALKVGKADNVGERISKLSRSWGSISCDSSYCLSEKASVVSQLEKSLHLFLRPYAVRFDDGDGKTELFELAALEAALAHIQYFIAAGVVTPTLQRGLIIPKRRKLPGEGRVVSASLDNSTPLKAALFRYGAIHGFLLALCSTYHRMLYQIDFVGRVMFLRLKLEMRRELAYESLTPLLPFLEGDYALASPSSDYCLDTWEDGIFQLKVNLQSEFADHPAVEFQTRRIEDRISQLPLRSSLLDQDLPILV